MLTVERGGGPQPERRLSPRLRRRRDYGGTLSDVLTLAAVATLGALGALNLLALGDQEAAEHQLTAVAGGAVLFLVLRRGAARAIGFLTWALYLGSLGLLLAVDMAGVGANGATRWLSIGPVTFQPSEIAKIGLLLTLAAVLGADWAPWRRVAAALLLAVVPIGLTLLQPDLSTATLMIALTVALLVLGRVPMRFLVPLLAGAVVLTPLVVDLLRPYQLERVHAFVSGADDPQGSGYAIYQAHVAVASGGMFGLHGEPLSRLRSEYLPGRENDLAMASLVQQHGVAAGAAALLAAAVIVWRLVLASRGARTRSAGLVAAGMAMLLGVEVLVSLAGNLGVVPLAGVPFPLLSAGGTAAVAHLAAIGVALGVRRESVRRRLWLAPRWIHPRPRLARLSAVGVTGMLVVLSAYGWERATEYPALRAAGEEQMTRCERIPAPRGLVTDRNGKPIAKRDDEAVVVNAYPALLGGGDVRRLAKLVREPEPALRKRLAKVEGPRALKVATVPAEQARKVEKASLPGVFVSPSPRRIYPYGELFGPMLGFVGVATKEDHARWPNVPLGELVGRAGLEQRYDPVLRGIDGGQCVYVDPSGTPVALGPRRDPVPGSDLRLSIDLGLQKRLTASLATALRGAPGEPRGDLGSAVAMDPRTGQVLAMASLPSYDNNAYGPPPDTKALRRAANGDANPMLEHVTQVVGPPGSTFKLVVAAANMADPWIDPDKVIPTGGSYTYGGHTFGNWRSFGPMNMTEAIAWSNDVYFYKLAVGLGADSIYRTASELGVGKRTGIDLPGESSGFLGNPRNVHEIGATWYGGSTVILGIGQGYITTTPLQASLWTGGVSTGRVVTPRLGMSFGAGDALQPVPAPKPRKLSFASTLGPVRKGMREAVEGGTAGILRSLPVPALGKTGSAEDSTSPNQQPSSWFTAAAPASNPEIVVTSYVRGGGHGSTTSGPVVNDALQYYFAHQEVLSRGR